MLVRQPSAKVRIVAIDPGTDRSGMLVWDNGVIEAEEIGNLALRARLRENAFGQPHVIAIEMMACYGMAVGRDVLETCVWIGRFIEATPLPTTMVFRKDVKIHLCGSMKAKDANIRAALIDKHGNPGEHKQKGKLKGITGHLWSALAIADWADAHWTP